MKTHAILIFALATTIAMPHTASAEAAQRSGTSDAASAKAQLMLRQITAERDAFRAEAEKLASEVEKRDKKIESLDQKIAGYEKRLGHSGEVIDKYKENSDALRNNILDAREKMQKLVDKYRELVVALKVVEVERGNLVKAVEEKDSHLRQCSQDNLKLYEANLELLEMYKDKSVWDAIAQAEPVTQLKRVEIENIAQQYRDKLHNLTFVGMER